MKQDNKQEIVQMDTADPVYKRFIHEAIASPATLFHELPDQVFSRPLGEYDKLTLLTVGSLKFGAQKYLHLDIKAGKLFIGPDENPDSATMTPVYNADCFFTERSPFFLDILNPDLSTYLVNKDNQRKDDSMTYEPPNEKILSLVPDRILQYHLSNSQKEKLLRTNFLELSNSDIITMDTAMGNLLLTSFEKDRRMILTRGDCAFKYDDEKQARKISHEIAADQLSRRQQDNGLSL